MASGCGEANGPKGTPPNVVVSNSQLLDLVERIGGTSATYAGMAPPATNPHTWMPPSEAQDAFKKAKIIFHAGGDLEPWFGPTLKASGTDAEVIDLSKSVKLIGSGSTANGHWVTDLTNAQMAAKTVAQTLSAANPSGKSVYEENLKKFDEAARSADAPLQYCASLPSKSKKRIVAGHDDLDYIAKRYGFKIVAQMAQDGAQTPTASQNRQTLNKAKQQKARLVAPSWGELDAEAGTLAQQLGITKVSVFSDSTSNLTRVAESLVGSVAYTVNALVTGVSGGKHRC